MSETTVKTGPPAPAADASLWIAVVAIFLGTFIAVLDNSLLNVALPKLMVIFGVSTKDIEWIVTGYMLASAVVVPLCGYLGDKFGYKTLFLSAVFAFTLGSLLCGLAWSNGSMIAFRIVQGLGGGFIMPVGMTMMYHIVPREKIPVVLGIWGISAMAAPALGPTLSGYLVDHFSWRLLFYINVPIGLFAILIGASILKETPRKGGLVFDLPGTLLSVTFFGTLLLALSEGQSEGWGSLYIVSLLYIAGASFTLLVYVELCREQPMLDLRLFKNGIFFMATLSSGFVMMAMQGGIFLMPLFLQNVQSMSPMDTGLLLMPQSIAMALMMPVSGKLYSKFGVVPPVLAGLSILIVTTFELGFLTADTPHRQLDTLLSIRGIGIGLTMMPLMTFGNSVFPNHLMGRASSVSNVFRMAMASLGIAVLTSILNSRQIEYAARISESLSGTTAAYAQFQSAAVNRSLEIGADLSGAQGGAAGLLMRLVQQEAFVRAIGDTFVISVIPSVLSLVCVFFFIRRKAQPASDRGSAAGQQGASGPAHVMEL